MIRLLVFLLAVYSALSLQIAFKAHFDQAPVLHITALRTAERQKHNAYRALHGCSSLMINGSLNTAAQKYADSLANSHSFDHSPAARSGKYGENLFKSWGSPSLTYAPGTASESWYSEEQFYNYDTFKSNDPNQMVGHFTAMIWKSVKSVGFGYSVVPEDDGYAIYVVANYWPTPNVRGKYAANVPKKI